MEGFFPLAEFISERQAPSKVAKCGACRLFESCLSPKMEPTGKFKRKILVVSEAPGKDEDKHNQQLRGNAGIRLKKELARVGIDMREDCLLTNSIICRPPKNAKPTEEQISHCLPNLIQTVEEHNPEVIILLGGAAVKAMLLWLFPSQSGGAQKWMGWQIPSQQLNAWICPTLNPSWLEREENNKQLAPLLNGYFHRHLKAASRLSGRPFDVVPNYESEIEIVTNDIQAIRLLRKLHKRADTIAFDYETNMLRPDTDRSQIVTCSICFDGKRTIAYPWTTKTRKATGEILFDPKVRKLGANVKFEDRWTHREYGQWVEGWYHDMNLAAHWSDNRDGITNLDFQSFVQLGQPPYNEAIKRFLKSKSNTEENNWREIGLEKFLLYNGMDSLLEYKIGMKQLEEFE